MAVRLKITILFTIAVVLILAIVCGSVFYFFQSSREISVENRLISRAKTVGRLLTQRDYFSNELLQKLDASKSYVMKNNFVKAFDSTDNLIYEYKSFPADTLHFSRQLLAKARTNGSVHYKSGRKDAVAYYYQFPGENLVIVDAGEDEEGIQLTQKLVRILLISFFGGITLSALGGFLFSKRLLLPINKITSDVKDISALNLSRRIDTGKTKDEWHLLSSTLNDLLNRLQNSFETQKRFIANASHEISTPLTSISSQIEVSLQRERNADAYKQVLHSIYHDVVHLTNLTQTLLQFAKASGTAGGLEIELVRIDEVLMQLPYEVAKTNNEYSVTLQFERLPEEEEKLLVFGSEKLLLTAVKNVVINACKYSSNHNSIVKLVVNSCSIKILIVDTGIGIPTEELKNVFQPFYRVAELDSKEGFGLGLSLASKIVSLHKGHIEVQSEVGRGTTFTLTIPSAKEFIKDSITK